MGQRCCGQKMRLENNTTSLRVRIAESNDPLTWGCHMGQTFGPEMAVAPTLTIADRTVIRLGANTANKTVFSALRSKTWTGIYCGMAPIPARLLRNIARSAGCHVYAEEGVFLNADLRYLAIQTQGGDTGKVSLPGNYDVEDAWTGRVLATDASEITAPSGLYELRSKTPPPDRKNRR